MDGESFDEGRGEALAAAQGELHAAMIALRARTSTQVNALLTDEQRERMESMRERHRHGRHHRKHGMHDRELPDGEGEFAFLE